jgi:hypothetical protein
MYALLSNCDNDHTEVTKTDVNNTVWLTVQGVGNKLFCLLEFSTAYFVHDSYMNLETWDILLKATVTLHPPMHTLTPLFINTIDKHVQLHVLGLCIQPSPPSPPIAGVGIPDTVPVFAAQCLCCYLCCFC